MISPLNASDILAIVDAFRAHNWPKPRSTFDLYLQEQETGERLVWTAWVDQKLAGYVTLKWDSTYLPFREQNIPEIMDLNVLPPFRQKGIGSALLDKAEEAAFERSENVGLGVGLYADYGSAQRLYVKRGYIPDGRGITYQCISVPPGNQVCLDDDLVLWWLKERDRS